MNKAIITTKAAAIVSSAMLILAPLSAINAESVGNGGFTASVTNPPTNQITINSVTAVKNSGQADGTFENGWKWIIDVTVPINEQNLAMKLENWMELGSGTSTIPVANNVRFYSSQSSNAFNQSTAVYITQANTYSGTMFLVGNLESSNTHRRLQITVEARIPQGSPQRFYSTNFGIRTQ